ncbi:MAG: methylamine utilization protein MauJ, partial [Polyangia bacterium]
ALVIAEPEPRSKGQPSGVRLDIAYLSRNNETKECAIMLRPNKHGRLSTAVTTLAALGYRDARDNAYRALLPFLSKMSFENNVPLEIKASVTKEISTGGQNTEFRSPFPFERFQSYSQGLHRMDILALLSFYREGMNSTSISYSFLCFYRILEAIYKRRRETAEKKKVRFSFKRENRILEGDLMGLPKRMPAYHEFVGKKFRSIYDNNLTPLRVSIAHGLLGDDNPIENTPDDLTIRSRAGFLIPIAQILSRLEIQNELTRDEVPITSGDKDKETNPSDTKSIS